MTEPVNPLSGDGPLQRARVELQALAERYKLAAIEARLSGAPVADVQACRRAYEKIQSAVHVPWAAWVIQLLETHAREARRETPEFLFPGTLDGDALGALVMELGMKVCPHCHRDDGIHDSRVMHRFPEESVNPLTVNPLPGDGPSCTYPGCGDTGWVEDETACGDEDHCDPLRPCPKCNPVGEDYE